MKVLACVAAAVAAFLSYAPARAETTPCTEITSLPITITVQGIYCLKQNLNVNQSASTSAAITINAGNVTIDFNGFRVNNQAPLANTFARGVYAVDRKHITLKNGFIRGFYRGIFLKENTPGTSAGHQVEGMKIADSGYSGIGVDGDKSVVRDNRVLDTGGGSSTFVYGIILSHADDGLVANNLVSGVAATVSNNGILIQVSDRVRVSGNDVTGVEGGSNADQGIVLFSVNQAIIAGNRLLNDPGTGTSGIYDNGQSSNVACRNNEVGGFSSVPFSGCDVNVGNAIDFN